MKKDKGFLRRATNWAGITATTPKSSPKGSEMQDAQWEDVYNASWIEAANGKLPSVASMLSLSSSPAVAVAMDSPVSVASPELSGRETTSGMSMRDALHRGTAAFSASVAGAIAAVRGIDTKEMKEWARQCASSVADSMSGTMDYLTDSKRMLFRTDEMVGAMDGLLMYVQRQVNAKIAETRGIADKLVAVDMKALRKYVDELVKSEEFGKNFTYDDKKWTLDKAFAADIARDMKGHLKINIDAEELAYHLENIVNTAVNSMERVDLDKTTSIGLFFDKKYHGAALAAREGWEHTKAKTSHNLAKAGAHMAYGKAVAGANLAYAGAVTKANAKIAGAYVLKAGTYLNQYLAQPAWRFITNFISTAFLAAASVKNLAYAAGHGMIGLGRVGSGKEGLNSHQEKAKAILSELKAEWAERLSEIKGHIDMWKKGKGAAMSAADERIRTSRERAEDKIDDAARTRNDAKTKAIGTRDNALAEAAFKRELADAVATRAHRVDEKALTSRIAEERLAAGEAKAKKKVGQRTATALREAGRAPRTKRAVADDFSFRSSVGSTSPKERVRSAPRKPQHFTFREQ